MHTQTLSRSSTRTVALLLSLLALFVPFFSYAKESAIPAHAKQVGENVYYLGKAYDAKLKKEVDGYMIIRKHTGSAKPGGNPTGGSTCYSYIASGAKWRSAEPWVVNPTNTYGISNLSVFSLLDGGIAKWEDAANGIVGDGISVNILGNGTIASNTVLVADEVTTDGLNEVYFDALDQGTIGVTIVWGIFGGSPKSRQLVEWDQVYNTFYDWSDAGASNAMDFDNIATHELGHSVGMGDLYSSSCSEETMYGYSTEGDIQGRTLNAGDIAGVNALY